MVVIGICGLNGSGKGMTAQLLKNKGFISYSTSDILREECFKKGIAEITRDHLFAEGVRMRKLYGTDVLVQRVLERIYAEEGAALKRREPLRGKYVIESIRNPGEVQFLRTIPSFSLWSIDADAQTRFFRLKARRREEDSQTFEDFLRVEQLENKRDPAGQQGLVTSGLADVHIVNDGTIEELDKAVKEKLDLLMGSSSSPQATGKK